MNEKKKTKFPIALKLILIISIIVGVAAVAISALGAWRFSEDSGIRAEKTNFDMNELQSIQIENIFDSLVSSVFLIFDTMRTLQANTQIEELAFGNFWIRNPSTIAVVIPNEKQYYNTGFFQKKELSPALIEATLGMANTYIERALAGDSFVFNASPLFNIPVAGIVVPFTENEIMKVVLILFASDDLQNKIQTNDMYNTFAINNLGDVVLHKDIEYLKINKNMGDNPIVKEFLKKSAENMQIEFIDADGISYFGAYRRLDIGGMGVVTVMPSKMVQEVIEQQVTQSAYLGGVVLCLSILCIFFFSKTVSRPIKTLEVAARKIEAGDYEPDIKPTSHDEIGSLTQTFIDMSRGLAERERIKNTFGKFVNKEIAEQAAKGELALGGTRREGTIFFSDIRSFTAISETLTPEKVVEFLNEYMSQMVKCVNDTHGSVDKFIGDAIMALWGIPLSQGSAEIDAFNCIRAALLMRERLYVFNMDRGSAEKPIIKIGSGINTGAVIAGQIGSEERMEYTVIGDAVNLASRIESLNKPFGTDILISENTYVLLKDKLIVEPMTPIKVKGKAEPLQIYAVVNLIDAEGPATLAEVRELLNITPPDVQFDPDESEVKYEILSSKK